MTERMWDVKTCPKMQKTVTKIANKYSLDLTAETAHLRLNMPGFDRLVIEKVDKYLVSVAHYYESRGDLVADPEMVFFTAYQGWIPIEITQVLGGWRRYVRLSEDGETIIGVSSRDQADLTDFAEMWADNIEAQGWLEHGQKWGSRNPANSEPPDIETLIAWESEGGCEATDGCWVEPDGTCPHGCQSWLLVMGLI